MGQQGGIGHGSGLRRVANNDRSQEPASNDCHMLDIVLYVQHVLTMIMFIITLFYQ